jgi:hypothetical protein
MKTFLHMALTGVLSVPVLSHARELLWDDTRAHTSNSFDAFSRGNQWATNMCFVGHYNRVEFSDY